MPAGSTIFDASQPCRGFPLVLEGAVRVAKFAPNGREILLYRVAPGQGCILSGGCLLGHSDYTARGVAEQDVTLLALPPTLFHELMLEHEPFRRFVFAMYGDRLAEVMELVEEVAFRRLDARGRNWFTTASAVHDYLAKDRRPGPKPKKPGKST